MQTHKTDQHEEEVHELREQVTKLQAEVGKLTSMVSSPEVKRDHPLVQRMRQPQHQPLCPQLPQQNHLAHHLVAYVTPVVKVYHP